MRKLSPEEMFEKARSEGKSGSARVLRKPKPLTLQQQIQQMLNRERADDGFDEDFVEGDFDTDTRSPHELVVDEETGLEMCRYEKELLDMRRPQFEKDAFDTVRKDAKKIPKNRSKVQADPGPKGGQQPEPAAGDDEFDEE